MNMESEIEAAEQELAPHLPAFDALLDDVDALLDRAGRLFAEPAFEPMRFSVDDVHRAFEAVGYPRHLRPDEGDAPILRRAIEVLATPPWRTGASARLMRRLPEYVAGRRYLDAALMRYCAHQLLEAPGEANPFTMEMFDHGLRAWSGQVEAQREALLSEMGLDRSAVMRMKLDQIEALIEARMADPAMARRVEAALAAGTMLGDQSEAAAGGVDRDVFLLLDRPDSRRLLLSVEEMDPWLAVFVERVAPLEQELRRAGNEGRVVAPELRTAIGRALHDTALEMAPVLFTPERLRRLAAELNAYRHELSAAAARDEAIAAQAAYRSLLAESDPADNRVVLAVCVASLHRAILQEAEGQG
jgi:hypothetical protein